jgi:hypothetical protein
MRRLAFWNGTPYKDERLVDPRMRLVSRTRNAILMLSLLASLGGCATVAVYQPAASAEISLTEQQSDLLKASDAYCQDARQKGLASGETSLGTLAGMLTDAAGDEKAYWRKIGADHGAPTSVVSRVRADIGSVTNGLTSLEVMARSLMAKTRASKGDVTQFERALIHARQARDSLSDALAQVNKRSTPEYVIDTELAALDKALASARLIADDLAAARADEDAV